MATELAPARVRDCLDACERCIEACEVCEQQCIAAADAAMVECARLCLDCTALCHACVTLLARESRFYPALCGVCAVACEARAQECGRFGDEGMRQCAAVFRAAP